MRIAGPCCSLLSLAFVQIAPVPPASAQVNATLQVNGTRLLGTHPGGSLLLYTPDPVALGSSISHWDTSAFPNLLMEPFLTNDLPFLGLDVTPSQMEDVLWTPGTLTVNIFDLDGPGTGFSDPTPFPGAPGNPATTLGEARVNLFIAALGAWANTLDSNVDVDVLVTWDPLFCDPGIGATLGAASTLFAIELTGGGLPGPTLFHAALAESLIGTDLTGPPSGGGGDIIVFVNSALDDECLGPGTGWYYGLDGNTPAGKFDTAGTLLHELAHGLGFSNFTNEGSGELLAGTPSIYDLWTFDNTTGKFWDQMTDAERVQSAANTREVTWEGPSANTYAATLLDLGVPELMVNTPPAIAATYDVGTAAFGPPIPGGGLTGDIVCLRDSTNDGTDFNGCTPAINPGELTGRIALIDRGACSFTTKVANAQAAGAIAAVIANLSSNSFFTMGGTDPTITIPSAMLGKSDGTDIRGESCPCPDTVDLTGTLLGDQTVRAALDVTLGPDLDVDGTVAVRILAGQAELRNNVALGGNVVIELAADACTAP